jgi:hypothetical protein
MIVGKRPLANLNRGARSGVFGSVRPHQHPHSGSCRERPLTYGTRRVLATAPALPCPVLFQTPVSEPCAVRLDASCLRSRHAPTPPQRHADQRRAARGSSDALCGRFRVCLRLHQHTRRIVLLRKGCSTQHAVCHPDTSRGYDDGPGYRSTISHLSDRWRQPERWAV